MACPNCLDCNNPCNDCQENVPATPTTWVPELPACTDGCEFSVPTDCVMLSEEVELCNATYEAGTPLTPMLQDLASAICCNCITCDAVTKVLDYTYEGITKVDSVFNTLLPEYFTKSNQLESIDFEDGSSIINDITQNLKYYSFVLGSQVMLADGDLGDTFSLESNLCTKDLINRPIDIWAELTTSRGCYESLKCTLTASKVDYSERIAYPYRFNAQINDVPVIPDPTINSLTDKGILYFNDVLPVGSSVSKGSTVRKVNLNTREITTISGNYTNSNDTKTVNGTNGTQVMYGFGSAIVADKGEIHNGEPVLYFATFGKSSTNGGVICRVVKEKDSCCSCDERENWTTYVLGNPENTFANNGSTETSGDATTFKNPYGLKRWYDVNGAPSFYIYDGAGAKLYYMYYNGLGSLNQDSSWNFKEVTVPGTVSGVTCSLGGISSNINVEFANRDEATTVTKNLLVTTNNGIFSFLWDDVTPPVVSESISLSGASWINTAYTYNASTCATSLHVDGVYDSSTTSGNTVTVSSPNYIFRLKNTAYNFYLYGTGNPIKTAIRSITTPDYIKFTHDTVTLELNPTGTTLALNPITYTGIGNSSASLGDLNGYSEGFFTDLQGNLYDMTIGGIRLWDPSDMTCVPYIGQSSALATELVFNDIKDYIFYRMDTQYRLAKTC